MKTKIAIVDDHELMARALSALVQKFENYDVVFEAFSGEDFIKKIEESTKYGSSETLPDIVLLDVNMPQMDGYEVARWIQANHAKINTIALSMNDKEEAIVKMVRCGAKGYLLKGCKTHELKQALDSVVEKGYYYSDHLTSQLIKNLTLAKYADPAEAMGLNEREKHFIQLSCSDMTYAEIADNMCVSPRTVDGYRESVFQKMDVKSRVGMVITAIRLKIYNL